MTGLASLVFPLTPEKVLIIGALFLLTGRMLFSIVRFGVIVLMIAALVVLLGWVPTPAFLSGSPRALTPSVTHAAPATGSYASTDLLQTVGCTTARSIQQTTSGSSTVSTAISQGTTALCGPEHG